MVLCYKKSFHEWPAFSTFPPVSVADQIPTGAIAEAGMSTLTWSQRCQIVLSKVIAKRFVPVRISPIFPLFYVLVNAWHYRNV